MWIFFDVFVGEVLEVDIFERGLVIVYIYCVDKGLNMYFIGLFNFNIYGYFL